MSLEEITSSELSPQCMRCMLNKYLDACPTGISWRVRAEYQRRVLRVVADGSTTMTAPEIGYKLSGVLREMFGIERRDFTEEKHRFNQLVLGLEEQIVERLEQSTNPLEMAVRCALVGNYIDFGPTGDVSESKLLQLIDEAPNMQLDEQAMRELEERIVEAHSIVYLTDNCGEIVLDKLLIAQILGVNPHASITAIVRGAPTSNDATMEDAYEVGLDKLVEVFNNGSDLAGTSPAHVNKQTLSALADSDLVISKGLANYETLSGKGQNARFLFLCKCALYRDVFHVPLYTGMIVQGV